jgi:hypothetical protein
MATLQVGEIDWREVLLVLVLVSLEWYKSSKSQMQPTPVCEAIKACA